MFQKKGDPFWGASVSLSSHITEWQILLATTVTRGLFQPIESFRSSYKEEPKEKVTNDLEEEKRLYNLSA